MRRAALASLAALAPIGCGSDGSNSDGREPAGVEPPPAVVARGDGAIRRFEEGQRVFVQIGCLACHRLGPDGNDGPGPDLTRIRASLDAAEIRKVLVDPPSPMPAYTALQEETPERYAALVDFLAALRR